MSNTLSEFQKGHTKKLVETMIFFLKEHTSEPILFEAMEYSVVAGGKRLRPLLLLAIISSNQKKLTDVHYQVAASLEMIHTYSLIHDDLPAMDNDDLRRGKLTNHKVYGEALAILAGDGLLTAAFECIAQADLAAEQKNQLILHLAKAAGTSGMVAGQVADIEGEGQTLDLMGLKNIHQKKTGALLSYAVYAGGLLAGLSSENQAQLLIFAQHYGLAFQIRDDILDVVGDEVTLGKKVGVDAQLAKNTYPGLLTLSGARAALQTELSACKKSLVDIDQTENTMDVSLLQEFVDLLKEEDK